MSAMECMITTGKDGSPVVMEEEAQSRAHKRRRVERPRIRVTRACDVCKKRKVRCSGVQPCALCVQSGQEGQCQYNASYTRGKISAVVTKSQGAVATENTPSESPTSNLVTGEDQDIEITQHESSKGERLPRSPEAPQTSMLLSSRNSPEPATLDSEGHYVGSSSGVSFLLRVQKRIRDNQFIFRQGSATSTFDFGDAPIFKKDPSLLLMPSQDFASVLVARYFDFAFPTHRFLHRPTIESWLKSLYNNINGEIVATADQKERHALLLMVFAQAKLFSEYHAGSRINDVDSTAYFLASEQFLESETGPVTLTSVQVRLSQCFYLLSKSRVNHAWILFGTTVRLAFAIGLHRRHRAGIFHGTTHIEQECRKRVFWCAYSLDNYLSAALGRPRSLHDEDCEQELPMRVDDSCILSDRILPQPIGVQSIMLAPVYHAKLSKILSQILRELYGIRRVSVAEQGHIVQKYTCELLQWRCGISNFLDSSNVSMMLTVYKRQHTVLNLAYEHTRILLYRPSLLRDFASLTRFPAGAKSNRESRFSESTKICIDAAMNILRMLDRLVKGDQMFQAFWFTQYYVFSAIAVLYVYVIQTCSEPYETWKHYLEAGHRGQNQLAASSKMTTSFAQRSVLVLEEMRLEILHLIGDVTCISEVEKGDVAGSTSEPELVSSEFVVANAVQRDDVPQETSLSVHNGSSTQAQATHSFASGPSTSSSRSQHPENIDLELDNGNVQEQYNQSFNGNSSASFLAQMTSWGNFDSLAVSGIGDLEMLLANTTTHAGIAPSADVLQFESHSRLF